MQGLWSGQTQQTVNLPPSVSQVRILPPVPNKEPHLAWSFLFFVLVYVTKSLTLPGEFVSHGFGFAE